MTDSIITIDKCSPLHFSAFELHEDTQMMAAKCPVLWHSLSDFNPFSPRWQKTEKPGS